MKRWQNNIPEYLISPLTTGFRKISIGVVKDSKIPPNSQVSPYQPPFSAESSKVLTNRTKEPLDPQHQSAYTLKTNGKIQNSTPELDKKIDSLGLRLSVNAGTKVRLDSATLDDKHENAEHEREIFIITKNGVQPATPETRRRAAEFEKTASESLQLASLRVNDSKWVRVQSDELAALAKHEKYNQKYEKFLREDESTARTSSTPTSHAVSRDSSSRPVDPGIVSAETTCDRYSGLLYDFKRQYNIDDARTSLQQNSTARTKDQSPQQGGVSADSSTIDAGLYRTISSSDLKGLPSDRSAREADASTAEKTATVSLEKRGSESFSADRKTSETEVTQSPDTDQSEQHLPGEIETQSGIHSAPGQDKLKDDEPLNVHRQQPETSLGTPGDRDTESPTIDAEVHTPGGREPDSTSSPASLPAAQEDITFITDEPPTATDATGHHDAGLFTGKPPQKGPEKSLLSGDDKAVDEAIDEVKVETRESVSTSPSMSHEPVRSRLASETDQTATGKLSPEATTATVTEPAVTPHDLAPPPDDKQRPAGSPSLPLNDETVTTETPQRTTGETVGETTAEDRVEERRQDQYRTPSPLDSHPSRQGGVSGDSSAIDTGLETYTTEQEIIEQTFSETREEVIIQDKPAASLPKEPTPGLTESDTEAGLSIPPSSDNRDPQYDQSLISSSPTHLPEDHGPLSFESQPSVVTTGSSSESDSDDTTSDSDADSVKSFGDRKDESTLHMTLDGFSKDKSELSGKDHDLSRLPPGQQSFPYIK
ncbi:hypothetical protein [Endozoicomonas atrinae]|uniref:hypothetical protein n=1 Tax=Endozoicomonas atrinae TaxID=1333660 RepID=UPI003AFF7544